MGGHTLQLKTRFDDIERMRYTRGGHPGQKARHWLNVDWGQSVRWTAHDIFTVVVKDRC